MTQGLFLDSSLGEKGVQEIIAVLWDPLGLQ